MPVRLQELLSEGAKVDASAGKNPQIVEKSDASGKFPDTALNPDVIGRKSARSALSPSSAQATLSPRRSLALSQDQVREWVKGPDDVSILLPDGRTASGTIQFRNHSPEGRELGVTGRLTSPGSGSFNFYIEEPGSEKGPVVGAVIFDKEEIAFSAQPGPGWTSLLTELPVDLVVCRGPLED